jgi:hypothetical protein
MDQKLAEFERLTSLEFPEVSGEDGKKLSDYKDPRARKLWAFWLQAYWAGKQYLLIEKPEEDDP